MSHWIRSCKSVVTFEAVVDDDIFDCEDDCICSGYIKVEKVVVFGRNLCFWNAVEAVWSVVGSQLLMSWWWYFCLYARLCSFGCPCRDVNNCLSLHGVQMTCYCAMTMNIHINITLHRQKRWFSSVPMQ